MSIILLNRLFLIFGSEHCQLDEGWEEWTDGGCKEDKKCGFRRRTRKIIVEPKHGGESCEKKYPDYCEEEMDEKTTCDSGFAFLNTQDFSLPKQFSAI